jgi:hypothetical protein
MFCLATPASAQWRIGGFVGGEHESSWDEFLVIGADARGAMGSKGLEINPRFSYFLRELTTRFQVDLNVLKPLPLASKTRLVPYLGVGLAFESVSYDQSTIDSESAIGYNYVVGATTNGTGQIKPFAQFQYTVLNDAPNNAVLNFGVHFSLGGSR